MPGQFVPGALRELCNLWSYPGFRRMQKLCCVKQGHVYRVLEARVGRGTAVCWGSSERILAGASHRAGVAPDGLGGFCSLLYPWQVSSDLLTHCKRKRWHIAASGNIVRPTVGNSINSWVGDGPDLLGFVSAGKRCFSQFFYFRKQRPKKWSVSKILAMSSSENGKNEDYSAVWI